MSHVGTPESDEELVRRALAGDRGAFGTLVERHERRTYNLALRMLGREDDARDATQDALLTAFRKLPSFRGDAAFATWLYRITVNACYDLLRRSARAPLAIPADAEPALEPGPPTPDHADATVGAIDVRRALLRLPPEHRAVLVLHDVQDLAYEEVAAVLGVPVGTVKSRLHRARVALARELRAEGAGERLAPPGPSEERR
ncbi:MAG TPA: sigma-70 family RNA polymerase sigma factor [Actinomycetota bacterium]|nr:sigma-70 family RNA polymerase sigma factor [Actinomycetota bacterium]